MRYALEPFEQQLTPHGTARRIIAVREGDDSLHALPAGFASR
ncbi:hypothetical protein [Streptomyces brevispora]|uniref:Uncharacterized protein n=1 Tax=Streptomyces brevispora TaxID=887462 RepID=A0A561UQQ9_9ACTN|nr:hypothetical protein [Streptomyces brevispora]TWG01713.1 hypothetical protein FHX80_1199 [Streptomyces brevispora]WSC17069.1 hypothetical protein OIE64_32400 [Streptomyces brevispora]